MCALLEGASKLGEILLTGDGDAGMLKEEIWGAYLRKVHPRGCGYAPT